MTRTIESYIFPLDSSVTPYNNSDFSPEVVRQCSEEFKLIQDTNNAAEAAKAAVAASNGKIQPRLSSQLSRMSNGGRQMPAVNAHSRLRVAKCIVVGDIAVGKTCLINRFGYNVYGNDYKATIGVDFDVQKFEVLKRPFSLQIWDTAGQDRFRIITRSYYRGAHVAVIVFDLTNMASFLNVRCWLKEIMDTISPDGGGSGAERNGSESMPFLFLVGSKKDLLTPDTLKFFQTEGAKLSNEIGAEFWMISSQTGENVTQLFGRISCLTFNEIVMKELKDADEEKMPANGSVRFMNRNSGVVFISVPNNKQLQQLNNNHNHNNQNGVSNGAAGNNNTSYYDRQNDSLCGRITNRLFYKFRKQQQPSAGAAAVQNHKSSTVVPISDSSNGFGTNPFETTEANEVPYKKRKKKTFSCFNLNCVVSLN